MGGIHPVGGQEARCPECEARVREYREAVISLTAGWLDSLVVLLEQRARLPKGTHLDYDATAREAARYRDRLAALSDTEAPGA